MKKTNTTKKGQVASTSNSDTSGWIVGWVLLCVGLVVLVAVFCSFFCGTNDISLLMMSAEQRSLSHLAFENPCGQWGAWLGWWLVDRSFGLFGVLIPVLLMVVGIRLLRRCDHIFNKTVLVLLLVMLLGSLTLGALPAMSTRPGGLGGECGIAVADLAAQNIGTIGLIITLICAWVLLGVFINRKFIKTVNSAGNAVVGQGERIYENVRQKVNTRPSEEEYVEEEDIYLPPSPAVVPQQPAETAPVEVAQEHPVVLPPRQPRRPVQQVQPVQPVQPARQEEYNPFFDDQPRAVKPLEDDLVLADEENAAVSPADDRRVVLGRNGLVELAPRVSDTDSPFEEYNVDAEGHLIPSNPPARPAAEPAPQQGDDPFELRDVEPATPYEVTPHDDAPRYDTPQSDPEYPFIDDEPQLEPQPVEHTEDTEEGLVVTVEAPKAHTIAPSKISTESYDPLKDLMNYKKPPVTLLEDYVSDMEVTDEEIYENKTRITTTLKNFGFPIQRIKATVGPTVTLYEVVQAEGVRISRIEGLHKDLSQALKAESGIRIIAPIPGRGTIGIEVPNRHKQIVSMYSGICSKRFQESKAELPIVIGRTIQNENFVFDLAKMPHLLVAGSTGQGKSVGLNAIITSLLYRKHPAQLKFVMIDPKMVELSLYGRLERHFLARMASEDDSIVIDPRKAVYTLNSLCMEMDARLDLCRKAGVRNITEYNEKFTARRLNPEKGHRYMPYIVVVIDEFSDLIMTAKEVETPVVRLAQKARAIGIHLIIATQRPSVDVITGKIKANFPARIAFRVVQMIDSRTILDRPGAEQLIGRGDMLISKDGEITRVQCAFVDTPEVERVVNYIEHQQGYTEPYELPTYTPEGSESGGGDDGESSAPQKYDSLFAEIAREAVSSGRISTSMIQRDYEVGFNRAGRIMLQLERAGIVSRQQGVKPREILYHDLPALEAKLQDLGLF